jgi:hypothetical protein
MGAGVDQGHRPRNYYLVQADELDLRAPAGHAHRRIKIRGRAPEVSIMNAWKRWQDWSVVVLGAILFVTPFVFGETAMTTAAASSYILGVLVVLAGLLNAAMRSVGGLELIPAVLAVIVFISPWLFGFATVTALAWSAWVVGVLLAIAVGSLYPRPGRRVTA